jgi:hypothetical protein
MAGAAGRLGKPYLTLVQRGANQRRAEQAEREGAEAAAAEAARVAKLSDTEVSVPSAGRGPHNHTGSVSGVYIF